MFAWAELYENLPCFAAPLVRIISVYAFPFPPELLEEIRQETRGIKMNLDKKPTPNKHHSIGYEFKANAFTLVPRPIGFDMYHLCHAAWAREYERDCDEAYRHQPSRPLLEMFMQEMGIDMDEVKAYYESQLHPDRAMLPKRKRRLKPKVTRQMR